MPDSEEGRRLHAKAEEAREAGKFLEALEYTDKATLAYQKDGDMLGLAEVQSSRQSTFKHLYRAIGDRVFLILEKQAAESTVAIAEESSTYNKNAWASGAHIRIAEMLVTDNLEHAKKHFEGAKKIIDSDKRQILRKEQLKKLQSKL